ncbi:MAG: YifB family Mg chelatase-like AAA ATPase [bacterium]|nr:YifB family Mg chelatase-like AAA ATPase [bacterium]
MLAISYSGTTIGVDAFLIKVEVDAVNGIPYFSIVGLPDASVRESKERIISAVRNSKYNLKSQRITVNLAPADLKKEGALFDLPMTIGIMASAGEIEQNMLANYLIAGELSLSGEVRQVKGALPLAILAKNQGFKGIILPAKNKKEISILTGIEVVGVNNLAEAVNFLNGQEVLDLTEEIKEPDIKTRVDDADLKDIKGQVFAKRALEVAVSGGHNILMVGPPGSGKTMLARRISTIMPEMSLDEAIETTKVHSVAGILPRNIALLRQRPFRSPHHTVSDVALVGGGSVPKPGEVSKAHNGVLFLDELPEFGRNALEVLRQPLEDGFVTIARAKQTLDLPAQIMLVAAMNPCPCGYHSTLVKPCHCTPMQISRYKGKISGPLLDRIDIHVQVQQVAYEELIDKQESEPSADVRARVVQTRAIQNKRFQSDKINNLMNSQELKKYCALDAQSNKILKQAVDKFNLSARSYTRILKVSRTIADMEFSENIASHHILEAIQYRFMGDS